MDLGSLNLESIENIINSMSQQDIDMLSSIASEFSGGTGNSAKTDNTSSEQNFTDSIDFDTITRIASVIGKISSQPQDPGCQLLMSLKPMLSPGRRHKADEAIKMMQLISLLPLLKDLQ